MTDERAVLEAIAFGTDARISPSDRIRAIEMLKNLGGPQSAAMAQVLAEVEELSGEALDDALAGYFSPGYVEPADTDEDKIDREVKKRVRRELRRHAKGGLLRRPEKKQEPEPEQRPRQTIPERHPEPPASSEEKQRRSAMVIRLDTGEVIDTSKPMTPVEHSKLLRQRAREQIAMEKWQNTPPGIRQHIPKGMDPRLWARQWPSGR
jgi:hypothetical protein